MLALRRIDLDKRPESRRRGGIFASQVGADDLPTVAAVARRENGIRAEIQHVRICYRKNQRRSAIEAILPGAQHHRRNVARLSGRAVEHRNLAAVNQIGMQRIRRDVAVFFHANRRPVAKSNFAKVTAAGGSDRAALLLGAIDPVRKLVVGDDVVELRGRLVVPGTPGLPAIHADGCALVYSDGDNVWDIGIDPNSMVVVAAGRAFDGREILARVGGSVGRSVGHIDHILISRIDAHAAEVVAASVDTFFVIHLLPAFASVIGAVDAATFLGVDPGIHAVGIAGRNSRTDATYAFGGTGQSFGELPPGVATVGGFVEATPRSGVATADSPWRTARGPHAGKDYLRVARIESKIHAADVFVFVEDFLEGLAAVERPEDTTLRVRSVGMPLGRDEETIGLFRIYDDGCDLLRVAQSEMLPGAARVGRLVDAVAYGEIGPAQAFAAADVYCVGIRGRDCQGTNRTCRLIVENWIPGAAEVRRLPNSPIVRRHVEDVRLARNTRNRHGAAAAKRADHAPMKFLVHRRVILLGGKG